MRKERQGPAPGVTPGPATAIVVVVVVLVVVVLRIGGKYASDGFGHAHPGGEIEERQRREYEPQLLRRRDELPHKLQDDNVPGTQYNRFRSARMSGESILNGNPTCSTSRGIPALEKQAETGDEGTQRASTRQTASTGTYLVRQRRIKEHHGYPGHEVRKDLQAEGKTTRQKIRNAGT